MHFLLGKDKADASTSFICCSPDGEEAWVYTRNYAIDRLNHKYTHTTHKVTTATMLRGYILESYFLSQYQQHLTCARHLNVIENLGNKEGMVGSCHIHM